MRGAARAAVLAAGLLGVAACIPIPYKPAATATPDATVVVPPETVISCDEDDVTGALAKRIGSRDQAISFATPGEEASGALPREGSTLGELTDPARRTQPGDESGITYLVLIGDVSETETSRHGGFIPLLGAGTWTSRTNVTACVIDLTDGQMLTGVSAVTEARSSGVIYGFYGVFLVPMSESSLFDAIADSVVATIREKTPHGPVKIAIARVLGLRGNSCPDPENCVAEPPVATQGHD